MRIATWNVNSVRTRLPRVLAWLERNHPDVLCLQETKVTDDRFPREDFEKAGYHAEIHGQKTYNGVALLCRGRAQEVRHGFPGDPDPSQARVVSAAVGDVLVISVYVPNGKAVGTPQFTYKLAWLDALGDWLGDRMAPPRPVVVAGDFNIAPEDRDVYDPTAWRNKILCHPEERRRLRSMEQLGLRDLLRLHHPEGGQFSWWDYRQGAFHRGWGLRIDLLLGSPLAARRCRDVWIDREERKASSGEGKPSDHAPVFADLDEVS